MTPCGGQCYRQGASLSIKRTSQWPRAQPYLLQAAKRHASTNVKPKAFDILGRPLWSVLSLLPEASTSKKTSCASQVQGDERPPLSSKQLHHLFRLSALKPPPKSSTEEKRMMRTLTAQLHFVKEIQGVDTTGVEPLRSIRDETPEAIQENEITLDTLQTVFDNEQITGWSRRITKTKKEPHAETIRAESWDVLGNAKEKSPPYFVELWALYCAESRYKVVAGDLCGSADVIACWNTVVYHTYNSHIYSWTIMEKLSLWGSSVEKEKEQDKENGLNTLLTDDERGEVFRLVGAVMEAMRTSIKINLGTPLETDSSQEQACPEQDIPSASSVENSSGAGLEGQEASSSAAALSRLGDTLLQFLDRWQSSVTLRLGEVLNSREASKHHHHHHQSTETQSHDSSVAVDRLERDLATEKVLRQVYPPIPTTLADISQDKRVLILHSILLMLLSLEHYVAYSRVLLLRLTSSLELSLSVLEEDEKKVAQGLLEAAKHMSGDEVAKKRAEENRDTRFWKVGIASVAGAALIGVTGGLAAPLVAAGIGGVMGGLGLGATAAAGYLGTLAGSSVLVGGLFGAYGGRMTGKMLDSYAREIEDFAFVPVRGKKRGWSDVQDATSEDRRLRVTVAISGWLTDKEEVVRPWHVLGHQAEIFALRYELDVLLGLGNALTSMVKSAAWGYAKNEIIKRTIFASLTAALWPLGLLKVGRVVDNPFSVAKARSDKAGTILADALIKRAPGERPVTLVGYSLGARVIYSCLKSLAERDAFGLVESAVLMGAPTPSITTEWQMMRTVVAGRLVNIYSENDYILGFLYRTSSIQLGIAGLQNVHGVPSVENVDVSDIVDGHLRYRYLVGKILKRVGFEDIDPAEIDREEQALRVIEIEEEQKEKERGLAQSKEHTEANADEDVKHLENEIQMKNQQTFTRTDELGKHSDTSLARE